VCYRAPRNQWQAVVDAVRPRGAGSDGATRGLTVARLGRSAVAGWDASADNPCRVRGAFGLGGQGQLGILGMVNAYHRAERTNQQEFTRFLALLICRG
jgi:hypothetical protein